MLFFGEIPSLLQEWGVYVFQGLEVGVLGLGRFLLNLFCLLRSRRFFFVGKRAGTPLLFCFRFSFFSSQMSPLLFSSSERRMCPSDWKFLLGTLLEGTWILLESWQESQKWQ